MGEQKGLVRVRISFDLFWELIGDSKFVPMIEQIFFSLFWYSRRDPVPGPGGVPVGLHQPHDQTRRCWH